MQDRSGRETVVTDDPPPCAKHECSRCAFRLVASGAALEPFVQRCLTGFECIEFVIQRKRLNLFFGYDHRFEAYVPPDKRVLGYFALPVLAGDKIVAAIDLKTDLQAKKLLVQKWTWLTGESKSLKIRIEEELHRFEAFQLPAGAPIPE